MIYLWMFLALCIVCVSGYIGQETERGIGGLFFLRHGDPRCTHLLLHHVVNWR